MDQAARFLRVGVATGAVASVLVAFPTGDLQAKLVARHQPVALAAMEGRFESGTDGRHRPHRPAERARASGSTTRSSCPGFLSFLAFGTFHSNVPGLKEFPGDMWPDNIELLYYAST